MHISELPTPAVVIDLDAFEHNVATMGIAWPGRTLRPHVKAFKSTALARRLAEVGHTAFCCATTREVEGMAAAGLGDDLLLANEVLDATRLGVVAARGEARITVAVDSSETIAAAAAAGIREVLIDVDVGMPRCGCAPADAGQLADQARRLGLGVRGVMGYEGHVVGVADRQQREEGVAASMALLLEAHDLVGGEVVSGGGTGSWDANRWVTELQAGSYTLMDTHYAKLDLPFRRALHIEGTVISRSPKGWAVADVGLKCLGMDHGLPRIDDQAVWFCSDEHVTFGPRTGGSVANIGDRVSVWPAHIDPTIACHERLHVCRGDQVVDEWAVDLRGW